MNSTQQSTPYRVADALEGIQRHLAHQNVVLGGIHQAILSYVALSQDSGADKTSEQSGEPTNEQS